MEVWMRMVTGAMEKKGLNSNLFLEADSTRLGRGHKTEGAVMADSGLSWVH